MKSLTLLVLALLLHGHGYAQHDPGRNSMQQIARGNFEGAIKILAEKPANINSDIDDAERAYVRALMACKQDNLQLALTETNAALAAGMPIGRFIAGPRDVFEKLCQSLEFKALLGDKESPVIHGPMLGCITDNSAKVWVRTAAAGNVHVEAGELITSIPAMPIKSTQVKSSADNDFTAVVTLGGLKANTPYVYTVKFDGMPASENFTFTTRPPTGKPTKFRVAFGGGSGFTPIYEHMWTTIKSHKPDALILLGDNVYIDDPEHQLTQKYCYYRRQSQAEWIDLVNSVGVYTIYDDHDFSINDCIPGPEINVPAWKPDVWKTFVNNWNNPGYGGGTKQPGCWYSFEIGDVQFIMLDGRYYRDLKGGSMLGPVQKTWLLDTLKKSAATFKVIASPVPWSAGVKPGSKDTWDGYNDEREEIFGFIEKQKINGVLLMSADRHRTDMRMTKRPNAYDLYDVMSSRLTNVHTHPLVQKAKGSEFIMGYNEKCSFGRLDFDTTAESPEITFSIINIDGETMGSRTLNLKDLSFKK